MRIAGGETSIFAQGDLENAIADYSMAIKLNPKDADAYEARGKAYGKKNEPEKSIADYTEAIRLRPKKRRAALRAGREIPGRRRPRQGDRRLCGGHSARRRLPRRLSRPRRVPGRKDKFAEAAADWTAVIRLKPALRGSLRHAQRGIRQRGTDRQGDRRSESAIRLGLKDAKTYCRRAQMYVKKRDGTRRLPTAKRPFGSIASASAAYGLRAACHSGMHNYADAVEDCSEAIRLKPDDPQAYRRSCEWPTPAWARWARRFDDFAEAIRLGPNNVEFRLGRAEMYMRGRDFANAAADLTEAIRLDPGRMRRGLWLPGDLPLEPGQVCRGRGRLRQGPPRQSALGQRLRHAAAWPTTGWATRTRAVADLTQAVELDPKDIQSYWTRADAL